MRVYRFEEPVSDSLGARQPRRRRRRWLRAISVVLVLLAALGGVAWWLGRDTGARIPAGTSIAGVDVGGLTGSEARDKVRAHGQAVVVLRDGWGVPFVPAKVAGAWRLDNGRLALVQDHQRLQGTLSVGGKSQPITGSLRGNEITLTAGRVTYTGIVDGTTITGTVTSPTGEAPWRARR